MDRWDFQNPDNYFLVTSYRPRLAPRLSPRQLLIRLLLIWSNPGVNRRTRRRFRSAFNGNLTAFFRGHHHHQLTSLHFRKLLHDGMRLQFPPDAFEQPYSEFLMRHFAAAKTQRDLGFVAFFQKPDQVPELDLVVALIGARAGI